LINSWFDPQAAHQAGTALIDGGADFLFGIMDESAYLKVAEQRKVWAAMDNSDIRRYGPDSYVSSALFDWRKLYVSQVKARLDGTWKPRQEILLPMGDGTDRDAWGAKVPEAVQKQAEAVRDKMLKGWTPFVGEIKDTDGKVRVKAGETMGLMELYNWSWPIEGVTGLKAA
jgi:basic membrane lipoprotein Med (substrate-binding protein (PBP1-ABC) superfamily)